MPIDDSVQASIKCEPSQVARECLGMLADIIAKLRERVMSGDADAPVDLEFLADDLCTLVAEYRDITSDVDPGEPLKEAA